MAFIFCNREPTGQGLGLYGHMRAETQPYPDHGLEFWLRSIVRRDRRTLTTTLEKIPVEVQSVMNQRHHVKSLTADTS